MYNIIQLNEKRMPELQAIAKELGLKKISALRKEELIYKILDEQAIAGANKKVEADKKKEDNNKGRRRRRVTVKKEVANKVMSANTKGETKKVDQDDKSNKTPQRVISRSIEKQEPKAAPEKQETPKAETKEVTKPQPQAADKKARAEFVPIEELPAKKIELP
ncbi:MAG: Rho termination factor N-terminal domain-containing protein, partial [Bacteroides sp.]|nr:Rho termination factor N-terminal domain-containing protein [Bacteroides sp.]